METMVSFIKNCKRRAGFITLLILIAIVPAWADVNITAAQVGDTNEVVISFDASSETNLVRAFALDIQLDNDANIVSVIGLSADYYIYPGTIQIDAFGNVIDYGTALAEYSDLPSGTLTGLDSNGITVEMASLYAPVGPGSPNAPAKSGDLLSIIISGSTCITISANVPRAGATGVVMENPDEVVTVVYPAECIEVNIPCCRTECLKATDPGYATWILAGKPDCWCYRHQCQGDADGTAIFNRYVALPDLNILKDGFGKPLGEICIMIYPPPPNCQGLCCDFDHISTFGRPCGLSDLNILKANFGVPGLPDCPTTHLNYYEEP